jgi:iron complex transport system substrate-binding protein
MLLAFLTLGSAHGARTDPRHRVLSLNLCTDELLLELADRADVVGVTPLARDCRISTVCAAASEVPALPATAEQVVAARPDLVLAGETGAGTAVAASRRLGVPVLTLPAATTLEAIPAQVATVAAAIGQAERGQAVVQAFADRLASVPAPPPGPRPVAAVYEPNGFLSGPGSLTDAVLARAGLANFATARLANITLEALIAHPPDLLVTDLPTGSPSLAEAMVWHPALRDAFGGRRVEIPGRDWICGSPATLEALERLTSARIATRR